MRMGVAASAGAAGMWFAQRADERVGGLGSALGSEMERAALGLAAALVPPFHASLRVGVLAGVLS